MPILYNAQMFSKQVREFCPLDDQCMNMLKVSVNEFGLSALAHDKVLRLSRTIADLDGPISPSPLFAPLKGQPFSLLLPLQDGDETRNIYEIDNCVTVGVSFGLVDTGLQNANECEDV